MILSVVLAMYAVVPTLITTGPPDVTMVVNPVYRF